MYKCVQTFMHLCGDQKSSSDLTPQVLSAWLLERLGLSLGPEAQGLGWSDSSVSPKDLPVSISSVLETPTYGAHHLPMGSGDRTQAFTAVRQAHTSLPEPPPQTPA